MPLSKLQSADRAGSNAQPAVPAGPLICIVGPTGAGKTAAALDIARFLQAEARSCVVINADSRQLYTDFPLITAQPSPAERAVCPHGLYGYVPSHEKSSAGQWQARAEACLKQAQFEGHMPLVVGGTGLYIKALLDGIVDIPACNAAISARLQAECAHSGPALLHERLSTIDLAYAQRIHPNDRQRIVRALEVWESTGKTFSWWHGQQVPPSPRPVLRLGIGLPLDELTPLLNRRVDAMLEAGALNEALAAWKNCPNPQAPAWNSIGCAELAAWIMGQKSWEQCVAEWKQKTRAYAKRQLTWFKADGRIHWLSPTNSPLGLVKEFLAQVSER